MTRRGTREARRWFAHAIDLDPGYAQAHSLLGATYSMEYNNGWNLDPGLLDRAEEQARRCFARQIQVLKSQEGAVGNRRLIDARVGFLGPKGQAAFVAMLPLGVNIPTGATLRIDGQQPIPLRLEFCTRMGCRAVTLLDDATLAALQGATALTVRFSPGFPGKLASIRLSPKGLAEAVKALR